MYLRAVCIKNADMKNWRSVCVLRRHIMMVEGSPLCIEKRWIVKTCYCGIFVLKVRVNQRISYKISGGWNPLWVVWWTDGPWIGCRRWVSRDAWVSSCVLSLGSLVKLVQPSDRHGVVTSHRNFRVNLTSGGACDHFHPTLNQLLELSIKPFSTLHSQYIISVSGGAASSVISIS